MGWHGHGGGGGCTQYHCRSLETIEPRIATLPGEHVGFSPIRQTLLTPSAKRREVLGISHGTARSWDDMGKGWFTHGMARP